MHKRQKSDVRMEAREEAVKIITVKCCENIKISILLLRNETIHKLMKRIISTEDDAYDT